MSGLQFSDAGTAESAPNLRNLRITAPERGDYRFSRLVRHILVAASEDIRRRVTEFRPGVYGDVGFGDGQNASHSLGGELVKRFPDYVCANLRGRGQQFLPDVLQIIKQFGVAISEFQQHVRT